MDTALLEVSGIEKSYGHVEALRGARLRVDEGQVVGLVGDNGAGKSTLVKILSGVQRADSGSVTVRGQRHSFESPLAARKAGVETVFQDLALAPDLDAAANMYLGREPSRRGVAGILGWIDRGGMRRGAEATFEELNVDIRDTRAPIATYSGGQQQGVAVARAAHWASSLLILDEPTAALGVVQTERVLELIRRVRDSGVAVILVSHSMPDVLAVCDRVTVLRLGETVAELSVEEATAERLVSEMTGARSIGQSGRSTAERGGS